MAVCATCNTDQREGCAHLRAESQKASAPPVCATCGQKECHHTNRDLSSGEVEAIRGQIRFQPVSVKQDRVEAEKIFSRKH
jgi:hypothetical protein